MALAAPHPDYAIDDDERLLLFDPLGVPSEIEALAAERETAIVLTGPWHERDRRAWSSGSRAPLLAPPESWRARGELGLDVRAGIHAGEYELVGEKIAGIAVVTGSRVCVGSQLRGRSSYRPR